MENGKLPETVEYPVLEVEGVPYQVKYTTGTLLRLQREGVDLNRLGKQKGEDGEPIRWPLELCFQVLAACISHGKRKFKGEELADLLPADCATDAVQKLTAAFSKASPQAAPVTIPEVLPAPQ